MAAYKAPVALKALVIGMGVVLLGLVAAVIYGIARQADRLDRTVEAVDTDVAVPRGCQLADVVVRDAVLVLRLDGPAERGCQQAVLVDPAEGRVLGRVRLSPQD